MVVAHRGPRAAQEAVVAALPVGIEMRPLPRLARPVLAAVAVEAAAQAALHQADRLEARA